MLRLKQLYAWNMEMFFKGWYTLLVLKILLLGKLFREVVEFDRVNKSVWLPDFMDWPYPKLLIVSILLLAVCLKRRYWLSLLVFFVNLWFYKLSYELINGGDQVILLFNFIGIFCQKTSSHLSWPTIRNFQKSLTSFCWLLGQFQLAMIYLVSGWDKLVSKDWQDGTALFNLLHVDFYTTNWANNLMSNLGSFGLVLVSWIIIVFEIVFAITVWIPKIRYLILVLGIIFHLFIAFGLRLPDFSLVMIWCYVIFLREEDIRFIYKRYVRVFKQNDKARVIKMVTMFIKRGYQGSS